MHVNLPLNEMQRQDLLKNLVAELSMDTSQTGSRTDSAEKTKEN
jgi:hypothetical protein